jgi:hypothetical protein
LSPLACGLFVLGILSTLAAAVVELWRPEDPRIVHLQHQLATSRAENVKLLEMEQAKGVLIQRLKGFLDQIAHTRTEGASPAPRPPEATLP